MYRSLTSTKSFNALRQRAEQAEQTHRRAEDYYRSYAGQYFRMTSMRQKLAHDGESGLPYQLFIAPRTVKLDTWLLDLERVDSLIQEIFRLFSASPFAIERITARLDKADRGLERIRDELRVLAEAINERIQAAVSEPLHLEAWDSRYEELRKQGRDAVAAWTMTLPETQKQIELGMTMQDILRVLWYDGK